MPANISAYTIRYVTVILISTMRCIMQQMQSSLFVCFTPGPCLVSLPFTGTTLLHALNVYRKLFTIVAPPPISQLTILAVDQKDATSCYTCPVLPNKFGLLQ